MIDGKSHLIEIYEPYDYHGEDPLQAKSVGVILGPGISEYYLMNTNLIILENDPPIFQIVINPRYQGDKIERCVDGQCTVGISYLKDNSKTLTSGDSVSYADIVYWGVGKVRPILT